MTLVIWSTLLPTLSLGGVAYFAQRHQLVQSYHDLLSAVTHQTSRQAELWLNEQETTASSIGLSQELLENWTAYRSLPERSDDSFSHLLRLQRIIRIGNESSKWITEVRLSNVDGEVVLSDNHKVVRGATFAPESAFDAAEFLRKGKVAHSKVYSAVFPAPLSIDSEALGTGFPTMFVFAPIVSEKGPVGIVACRLAVADLGRLFVKEAGTLPLDVFLLGPDGHLIASNRKEKCWSLSQTLPLAASSGYDLDGYTSYTGDKVVGAWEQVVGTDLRIVVQIPADSLTRPLAPILLNTLAFSLGLGLAFAAVAFFMANHLLAPLHRVIDASRRIARGDRTVRVNLERADELGQLSQSFDQMASTVEAVIVEMEAARDQALAATQAKSRFLANMTHELRTPLNAVIGYSEMLIAEAQDDEKLDLVTDLEVIRTAGKDLLALINGILDVSKAEAGKLELHPEHFIVDELVQEIFTLFVPIVASSGNTLKTDLIPVPGEPMTLGDVYMDRAKLKQILLNLLSNACKFTQGGEIEVLGRRQADELWLEVKDNGIGMSPEQQKVVFDEFAQADGSTTRKYGGTGLGLTIVQRFTEMLGGQVSLESELGQGSKFILHFTHVTEESKASS